MNYTEILKSDYFLETYNRIRELKKGFSVNHDFIHINGVVENSKYLADLFELSEKEKQLLLIASTLHDIGYIAGRENHAYNGSVLAREYLTGKMKKEEIDIVCNAIKNHGGKNQEDYNDKVSMCLILADKFDFAKNRYEYPDNVDLSQKPFTSIEKVKLIKLENNKYKLRINTLNINLFKNMNLEENYFFNKLLKVFEKLKNINIEINLEFCDINQYLF